MRSLLVFSLAALVAAFAAPKADAAVMIVQQFNPAPDPDLVSVTLRAVGTAGEIINSFAGINITGGVHNVQPGFGSPSTHRGHWTAPNGDSNNAWSVYDTHLLFSPADATNVVGFIGSMEESNDGSDPAGLALMGAALGATEGVGFYRFAAATDQLVLTPAAASSDVPFMQVVVPVGTTAIGNFVLFDTTGARHDINEFLIPIPEPATLAMGGLGLVGIVAVARRRKA